MSYITSFATGGGGGGVTTITGDTGGALTGSNITFTGGTTGLTFNGAGTTETLGGVLAVSNGGTGVATMTTAYAPIVAGTTPTGAVQVASTGLSTSGFVLTSNGASAIPSFKDIPAPVLNITSVTNAMSPYTVSGTDQFLAVDTTGGAVTIFLPSVSTTIGRVLYIKDTEGTAATNNITLTSVGFAVLIDGGTSFVMNTNRESVSTVFSGIGLVDYLVF